MCEPDNEDRGFFHDWVDLSVTSVRCWGPYWDELFESELGCLVEDVSSWIFRGPETERTRGWVLGHWIAPLYLPKYLWNLAWRNR